MLTLLASRPSAGPATKRVRNFVATAYAGGPMHVGRAHPVVVELSTLKAASRVPVRFGHQQDAGSIIGSSSSVRVRGGRLVVLGDIVEASTFGRHVLAHADRGTKWQVSISGKPQLEFLVPGGEVCEVNGRRTAG